MSDFENQNGPDLSGNNSQQSSPEQPAGSTQQPQYPNSNQQYQAPNQQYQNPNQQYTDPNQQYQNPNQQYIDPNQQYGQPYMAPPPGFVNQKSKIAAGLLGIFLGSFGVHNFYLGYTGKAVAQLLIAVLTCGIGAAATSIWGLIEGILILTGSIAVDGHGVPLKD